MNLPPLSLVRRAVGYHVMRPFGDRSYTRFIILSRSRTGSNLLNSTLGSHPNVRVKGEYFGRLRGQTIEARRDQVFGIQPRWIKAAGCKVFYYHPHHEDPKPLFDMLKADRELKVIHLKRLDTLRSVLSWMIAQASQTYVAHSDNALVAADRKRMPVDPQEMIERINRTLGQEQWGDDFFSGHDLLQVTYEGLTGDLGKEYGRVLGFLGLPTHQPTTTLRRQNPEPLEQLVVNYDEVVGALRTAGLEHMVPPRASETAA